MKIAILNECFFTQDHIKRLKKLGEVVIYENTNSEELAIERSKGADIVIADCFITPLNNKVISSMTQTKLININSTGYDHVDIESATKNNVRVANVPNFSTDSVAEQTIALMFAVNRKIVEGDKIFRETLLEIDPGNQDQRKFLGFNFKGKTLGIIGFGNIGKRVAELGKGLDMKVIAYNRSKKSMKNVEFLGLSEVLKRSDVVSLCLASSSDTNKIISKKEFSLMKKSSLLINTASGKLVDTNALMEALQTGTIAGAGLDGVADLNKNHPFLKLKNVVFSPHSGFFTEESLKNIADIITESVEKFANGKPINLVN